MVKIKLIKDQIMGKAGDVVEATKERANYLIRVGAAAEVKAAVSKPKTKPKTVKKPTKKKDAKG